MKFIFQNKDYQPRALMELYEKDSSYYTLIDFVRKWKKGNHTFEFQTSGSTGLPKKVQINRRQIEASVANTAQYLDLRSEEKILLCLNPSYIAAIMMAARGLILNMDVHIIKPTGNPFKELGNLKIDFASFVPFQIYQMIENGEIEKVSNIRNVLIGGAPLTNEAFEKIAHFSNNNYLTYGMTETVSHIGLMPIKGDPTQAQFTVLPNIFIGKNKENCLWIEGDVTNNQHIQTTDVVDLKDDRYFKWLGRKDNVINSGGVKIHPEQIEKIIEREFRKIGIENAFYLTGEKDVKLGEKVVLVIEGSKKIVGKNTSKEGIIRMISPTIENHFSKYHVPKKVKYLKTFQRTGSGKLIRD